MSVPTRRLTARLGRTVRFPPKRPRVTLGRVVRLLVPLACLVVVLTVEAVVPGRAGALLALAGLLGLCVTLPAAGRVLTRPVVPFFGRGRVGWPARDRR